MAVSDLLHPEATNLPFLQFAQKLLLARQKANPVQLRSDQDVVCIGVYLRCKRALILRLISSSLRGADQELFELRD